MQDRDHQDQNKPVDELLGSIFGRRKKEYELPESGFDFDFKIITIKEEPIDYSHRVVIKEKEFNRIFRYIKSLKKKIAKLKKRLYNK